MKIDHREISAEVEPFIVAEMSGNHNQSLDQALSIVEAAAESGVHALKIQTYTPDTMTLPILNGNFKISDKESLWQGRSLYELYQEAYTPWEWHEQIFKRATELGLIAFSTPFDETAVDFLESLNVPCYKIASFENADIPLIRKVASTGKPLIISMGMATISEMDEAVSAAMKNGCKDLILLKCTSTYPSSPEDTNLLTIPHLRDLFTCEVGLSDHTLGIGVSVASVALGATVIEKHFTLNRAGGGVDAAFSLEPEEMKNLVKETKNAWHALGEIVYGPTKAEKKSLIFRRSLYITDNLEPGDILGKDNLRSIRPGNGISPKYYDDLLGRKVTKSVKKGTPVSWEIFD